MTIPKGSPNAGARSNQNANNVEDVGAMLAQATELRDYISRATPELEKLAVPASLEPGFMADRLAESVIRPLREAMTVLTKTSPFQSATSTAPDGAASSSAAPASEESLWQVTREVSKIAVRPGVPTQVIEAAAALQDLVWRSPVQDGNDWAAHLAELTDLQLALEVVVQVSLNGPYLISNLTNLTNWLGEDVPTRPQMALCRCGRSSLKPLCDGTHAEIGFTGAKSPDRVPDRRDTYVGQQATILDNRGTCQHSGYCTDRLATVFHLGEEPFVTPSGGRLDEIIRAVRDCPSGALSYAMDGHEAREQVDYDQKREPSIEITKDGPYRITGGIPLKDGEGHDEMRNDGASLEHYALCRCGHSQNKPFCSGMHWYVDFHDPVPEADHEPTIFEWVGGLPALTRMTRLFYEKYVPQDPLLAPLFANMSADHPQRVARWLGEVFCGPKAYSAAYGGYTRMISQHVGKGLTEEKRARWVALLLQSAQEAGLPNDPEFRSAFGAYIEWGSRLAVENSQSGAHPPEHMPMPHWEWGTAAGAPGSRVSALPTPTAEADPPVVLPAADEPVRFEKHIKQLFRRHDRQSMTMAFDLWRYADVKTHSAAIFEKLQSGSMPCDGAWSPEWIAVFQRWVETGMSA